MSIFLEDKNTDVKIKLQSINNEGKTKLEKLKDKEKDIFDEGFKKLKDFDDFVKFNVNFEKKPELLQIMNWKYNSIIVEKDYDNDRFVGKKKIKLYGRDCIIIYYNKDKSKVISTLRENRCFKLTTYYYKKTIKKSGKIQYIIRRTTV